MNPSVRQSRLPSMERERGQGSAPALDTHPPSKSTTSPVQKGAVLIHNVVPCANQDNLTNSSSDTRVKRACSVKCFTIHTCTSSTSVMVYTRPYTHTNTFSASQFRFCRHWIDTHTHDSDQDYRLQ